MICKILIFSESPFLKCVEPCTRSWYSVWF